MTKLDKLYESIKNLQEYGVTLPPDVIKQVEELEEGMIKDEIIPAINDSVVPILSNLKRNLTLVIDYDPEKGVTVNSTHERVAVKERTARRYDLPAIPRIKYSLVAERDYNLLPEGAVEILMHKDLDWSLFNHGLTIPMVFHYAVKEAYGNTLHENDNVSIKIIIEGKIYHARLYSLLKNDGTKVMQILWNPRSEIAKKLQSMLPEQYNYMVEERKHIDIKHTRARIPTNMQREFFLCKTAEAGTYLFHLNGDYAPSKENATEYVKEEDAPIVCNKKVARFVYDVMRYFEEQYGLDSLLPFIHKKILWGVKKADKFNLPGMFLFATKEEMQRRNSASSYDTGIPYKRWYEDPFMLGEDKVYLSNQWCDDDKGNLRLSMFEKMIKECFDDEYSVDRDSSNGFELNVR